MECLRLSHPKKSGVAPNATAEVSIDSDVAKITFKGAWLLSDTRTDIAGVVKELNSDFVKKVRFDLSGVTTYDSSLISFLLRVYEASAQKNADFDFKSLPQGPRSLLRLAVAVPEGERKKVYVVEVRRSTRGVQIAISRSHPGLVKRLFELEVPEIFDGTVEIKGIAREAGSRTKIAVWSKEPDVDAIGACVGPRGARVSEIINELSGEKLDIVEYSETPESFISNALAPAQVINVEMVEEKTCRVTVPDNQLSLAIGREGQNARLAAKLTGYKIDIKSDSTVGL